MEGGYAIGRDVRELEERVDELCDVITALKRTGVVGERLSPYGTYWVVPDAVREKLGLPKPENQD